MQGSGFLGGCFKDRPTKYKMSLKFAFQFQLPFSIGLFLISQKVGLAVCAFPL